MRQLPRGKSRLSHRRDPGSWRLWPFLPAPQRPLGPPPPGGVRGSAAAGSIGRGGKRGRRPGASWLPPRRGRAGGEAGGSRGAIGALGRRRRHLPSASVRTDGGATAGRSFFPRSALESKKAKMRVAGAAKLVVAVAVFLLTFYVISQVFEIKMDASLGSLFARSALDSAIRSTKPPRYKCGISKACPEKHFAFKMASGAANVVGPKICLEDNVLMSGVKNNVGRGINVALVNGKTGDVIDTKYFDMWGGDVAPFIEFLKTIQDGTVVLMATYDDGATKLTDEARRLIAELGSTSITSLGFRDNWVFCGGKGIKTKSPFEQHIKNNKDTNKYEGWPEVVEMEGCIPQKQD